MGKKKDAALRATKKMTPAWQRGAFRVWRGPLSGLRWETRVRCDNSYPIGRNDWAYVTSKGEVLLNPGREADPEEWEYVISHCLLHLGFGHLRDERLSDPLWQAACDLVVAKFLQDGHIGKPPSEFSGPLPCPVKNEDQVIAWLAQHPEQWREGGFSTMTGGRSDMVWNGSPETDYGKVLAESLQSAVENAILEAKGVLGGQLRLEKPYFRARDWFLSSYPLLGAMAASFKLVDDPVTMRSMGIQVAAISTQLGEIYINPNCRLSTEEWRFVLAHEFLHAALAHEIRREDRDPALWNVACDFVINGWLVEMGVGTMPGSALLDARFQGMSIEGVYDALCEDIRFFQGMDPKDILYSDEGWWDRLEGEERDAMCRSALRQGLELHRSGQMRGYIPAGLVEEINTVSRPPIRWDVELAKWFDGRFLPVERRRTYARLSRRQSSTPDIPRPAWRMEEEAAEQRIFGVVLDTSSSMDRALLAAALGAIVSYSESREVRHVRMVFCDAAAYDQGVIHPEGLVESVKVRGRGGTKLQPGIDLLDADPQFPKKAPLLVITDGDCDRLDLRGREHAFLLPVGCRLPFPPKGPVFKLK